MSDDSVIEDVARLVASGEAVDWSAPGDGVADRDVTALLRELRVLDDIASFHRRQASAPPDAPVDPSSGDWGDLQIIRRVSGGSFGDVYEAYDPRLARVVALKVLHRLEESSGDGGVVPEGKLLAAISHPHVVTVYGASRVGGRIGLWMEFIHGETLAEIVRVHGPLSPADAEAAGRDVCRGLAAVHAAGLVHRDIKGQNVMREDGGRIVLMDLGAGLESRTADAWPLAGTPAYLAPELLQGAPATVQSDIYAVGVLLFHLTTGAFPVAGATIDELRAAHERGTRVSLRDLKPSLPRPLTAIVDRALSPNPDRRFASAADLGDALDALVSAPARRRRAWLAAGAVAAVVLGTVGSTLWMRSRFSGVAGSPGLVLVESFDNHTGVPIFDGTIRPALENALAGPALNVAPPDRVDDVLNLLGKAADTALTPDLARQVAQRDGDVRTLIEGRIDHLDQDYVITAAIVDSIRGRYQRAIEERFASPALAAAAIQRLAQQIRGRLGVSTAAPTRSGTRGVTTTSVEAARDFEQGIAMYARDAQYQTAYELFSRAFDRDPQFATARIWQAWCLASINNGHPNDEVRAMAEDAVARISTRTSDWETYWIRGSNFEMHRPAKPGLTQEDAQALSQYEALLAINPGFFWAASNVANLYSKEEAIEPSAKYRTMAADLRPNYYMANSYATNTLVYDEASETDINRYAERARNLMTNEWAATRSVDTAVVLMTPAELSWRHRDAAKTAELLDEAFASPFARIPLVNEQLCVRAGLLSLAMGRIGKVRELADRIGREYERQGLRAEADYYAGDLPSLNQRVDRLTSGELILFQPLGFANVSRWLFIQAGRLDAADEFVKRIPEGTVRSELTADLALTRGNVDGAIEVMRPVMASSRRGSAWLERGALVLANAYIAKGDRERAIDALALAVSLPGADDTLAGAVWATTDRFRLAAIYRSVNRTREADAAEAQAMRGLELADPAFLARMHSLAGAGLTQ